jgi:hypothetical protein
MDQYEKVIDEPIKIELDVGVGVEMLALIKQSAKYSGTKRLSVWARHTFLDRLCREGFLRHPAMNYQNQNPESK